MASRKPKPEPKRPRPPTASAPSFTEWKAEVGALLLERGGRPAGVPEKEWRRLYVHGVEPREAAGQAQAFYENFIRRPIPGVTGKRR